MYVQDRCFSESIIKVYRVSNHSSRCTVVDVAGCSFYYPDTCITSLTSPPLRRDSQTSELSSTLLTCLYRVNTSQNSLLTIKPQSTSVPTKPSSFSYTFRPTYKPYMSLSLYFPPSLFIIRFRPHPTPSPDVFLCSIPQI